MRWRRAAGCLNGMPTRNGCAPGRPPAPDPGGLVPQSHAGKHGRARRSWRKLHIAVDAGTGEIVACVLTDNGADDAGEVPALLEQIEGEVASVTADGAYDGEPVYRAVADHRPDPPPDVVIPPRASAVPSTEDAEIGRAHV